MTKNVASENNLALLSFNFLLDVEKLRDVRQDEFSLDFLDL